MPRRKAGKHMHVHAPSEMQVTLAIAIFAVAVVSAGFWAGAMNQFNATAFIDIILPCTGPIVFNNMADANAGADVRATWSGLTSMCASKLVYFKHDNCTGADVSGAGCSMGFDASGGCNFVAPSTGGTYTYAFCIDINSDGTFGQAGESATKTLHVLGPLCGNGALDSGETCDGTDLNGKTCADAGNFNGGTLQCNATCNGYITALCTYTPVVQCGNSQVEGSEACDGTNLTGKTCTSIGQGFTGGTLRCTQSCILNTTACTSPPQIQCGNGVVEGTEKCDGASLNGKTCTNLGQGFTGGTLSCKADCTFNTANCISPPLQQCSNGIIEGTEQCDGTSMGGESCTGQGFTSGTIKCTNCILDTSGCTAAPTVTATDAQSAINAAQAAITTARGDSKNVTEAVNTVNQAISYFNAAQYEQAKSQAEAASTLAMSAPKLPQADMQVVLIGMTGVIVAIGAAVALYFLKTRPKRTTAAPPPSPDIDVASQ